MALIFQRRNLSGPIESRGLIIAGMRIRQIQVRVEQTVRDRGLREVRPNRPALRCTEALTPATSRFDYPSFDRAVRFVSAASANVTQRIFGGDRLIDLKPQARLAAVV